MHARPLATAAVAATLLLGLSACEKPTPGVTVASGRSSVHVEATVYCRDGQTVAKQDCAEDLGRVGVVKVKQGERLSIDVDSSIADKGWILVDADANARSQVQDSHYFTYTPEFQQVKVINLEIRSLDRVADDAAVTGVWKFQLLPA